MHLNLLLQEESSLVACEPSTEADLFLWRYRYVKFQRQRLKAKLLTTVKAG